MAETPKHSDQRCSPEVPLPADDGCDRDHVIGIGCVSHTEEETDGDDGEQSKHQSDCECFTLRCSAPGGKAQDHSIAGTTIGALDRRRVVAAVPGIAHFGETTEPKDQGKLWVCTAHLEDLRGSQNREAPVAWPSGYRWPPAELLLVDAT